MFFSSEFKKAMTTAQLKKEMELYANAKNGNFEALQQVVDNIGANKRLLVAIGDNKAVAVRNIVAAMKKKKQTIDWAAAMKKAESDLLILDLLKTLKEKK